MQIVCPPINYINHRDFAIALFEIVYFRKCKREGDQLFKFPFFCCFTFYGTLPNDNYKRSKILRDTNLGRYLFHLVHSQHRDE